MQSRWSHFGIKIVSFIQIIKIIQKKAKDTFLLSYIRNSNLSRVLTEAITLPPFKKEFAGLFHCSYLIIKSTAQYLSDNREDMDSHRNPKYFDILRNILIFKYNAMSYRYFHLYANYVNIYEMGCKNSWKYQYRT